MAIGPSKYDTVVIGGGMSGLTCAALQARRGKRVAVVESGPHLSPTLRGLTRKGIYLDSGFHYGGSAGEGGLLPHLLTQLGASGALEGRLHTLEAFDRVRFLKPDFEFAFPQGWEALEQALCEAFPSDAAAVGQFLCQVKTLWHQGKATFLADYGQSLGTLFFGNGCSAQEAIDRCTTNPVLAALLSCHGILYGTGAHETSLIFHSLVVGSFYESACMVRGGGRVIVEALEAVLQEAGVDLVCGQKVVGVRQNDQGAFAAAELDCGDCLTARCCISTIHPKCLLELVPSHAFSPAYRRRILGLEETPSAVVLFGRCPSAAFSGNLILLGEPRAIPYWKRLPLEERPLFVSVAPMNDGAVSIICPATLDDIPGWDGREKRPEGYQDWKKDVADRLSRHVSTHADDLLGRFDLLDVATPLTFRDWLGSPEGGLYGVKHRLVDLPLLPRTRMHGLYLSGQAIVAPGVLGALCAGFLTDSYVS